MSEGVSLRAARAVIAAVAGLAILPAASAEVAPEPAAAQPVATSRPSPPSAGDVPLGQFRFRTFGTAAGLRNLTVVSITQDGNGLLWVATDDGVYRYDGQQLVQYSMKHGLPLLGVRVLGVAPNGAVCAGTREGMACWNGSRFSPDGAEGLPRVWVQALAAGPGVLWAGTSAGLYVRRSNAPFELAPGWPGASGQGVRALWADAEGVVASDGAILQVGAGNGIWHALDASVGLGVERIEAVVRDRAGTLWIRSIHHLWTLPHGATRVTDLSDGLPSASDLSGVACGMTVSPWGDVLVGTERGIAYRRADRWTMLDATAGVPVRQARTMFVDREGTIWIGATGLFQWMGRGLVSHHDKTTGLPDNAVWAIGRDRTDALWVGTGGCLARATEGRWDCLPVTTGWIVRSFAFDARGGVFIGGGPPDLLYVDAAGRPNRIALPGAALPDPHILALAIDPEPDGDLWIASTSGLFRLPGAQPGTPELFTVPGTAPDTQYVSFAIADGRLWVAGYHGLAVRDHGTWHVLSRSQGFRAMEMRHVLRRADGRMCVSFTDVEGLTCFRWNGSAASELRDIGLVDGLTSGRIYFAGEDRAQRLWIGTGDGVDVVSAHGVDHFDQDDGLAGNDANARAFFEDTDGSIWLGSSTGLSHVLAQHYSGPPGAPRATVLDSALGGEVRGDIGPNRGPGAHNSLAVRFASDSFINPQRVEFQVRLSPLERDWSPTRLREVHYGGLSPDNYQLEVRARFGAGAWGAPAELRFAVLPAWWQTGWFLAIAGGLVLASIAGGVTWRQRVLWRRRAQALHQRNDATFRDLLEAVPDLVSVHRDGKMVYLNRAARDLLGFDQAEGLRVSDLLDRVHGDDRRRANDLLLRESESVDGRQRSHGTELRIQDRENNYRVCELSGRRIDFGGGPVIVITGRDVTERDRLRAKLLLSDRMASLGTLAAGIAHEINNPLAYVTANLEVVAESLGDRPTMATTEEHAELRAAIGDAREGAERVRKIVRGLRTFSRSEEEKRTPIALHDVISSAIRLTSNEVKHRAVLVCDLGSTPPVLADDGRLTQVFINLLVNAAHAIPEGHTDANRITLRTRTDREGRAVIEIEDTGAGMPPEVLARAFDPFFTTKEVGEGTGLGLSICHGIISGLGGQITLESAPRRGCLVRVVLPPAQRAPVPRAVATPTIVVAPGDRRRVMIVDDDPQVAHALERMLRSEYDLTVVSCGADAIDRVTAGSRYDAIVTDVMMPNMTGVELFERLQPLAPEQASRMVFLTGGVFTAGTQSRLEASGNPQLQKPVSAQELRACIAKLVSQPLPASAAVTN